MQRPVVYCEVFSWKAALVANGSVLINGEATDRLAVTDRGLNYGDGVFRTLRIAQHAPVAWGVHLQRLRHDCQRLALPMPDEALLRAEAGRLFQERSEGVLKIVITRGCGGRGYTPLADPEPNRVLSAHEPPAVTAELELGVSGIRLARQPALAGVKHLNRLEQVLARAEYTHAGQADALMLDTAGDVISTTMRNIVLRLDGYWLTPELDQAGVAGAMRQSMMSALKAAGEPVQASRLSLSDCFRAQALIACNSVTGIIGVGRLADHVFASSLDSAVHCRALVDTSHC